MLQVFIRYLLYLLLLLCLYPGVNKELKIELFCEIIKYWFYSKTAPHSPDLGPGYQQTSKVNR